MLWDLYSKSGEDRGKIKKAALCAFPYTIPIFAGFCFWGMTYGIYMNVSGFSFWYPMLMSLTIFAGSMEFVTVRLLLGGVSSFAGLCHDFDGKCPSPFLRYVYAG